MHKTTQVKQSILVAVLATFILFLAFGAAMIVYVKVGPQEGANTMFGISVCILMCAAYAVYDTCKR